MRPKTNVRRRVALGVLLIIGASVTALVHAAQSVSLAGLFAQPAVSGQAMAARVHLSGAAADRFAKAWQDETARRDAGLREIRDALAAVRADRGATNAKRAMDRVQAAFQNMMDLYVGSVARLGQGLTAEEQARLVGGGSLYRIVAMNGMRQALPALVDYAADEMAKAVPGVDDATRAKLSALRAKQLARAMDLLVARAASKQKLADPATRTAALNDLAKNHLELAEAVAEDLRELRREVPDDKSAALFGALADRLGAL